MRLVAVELFAFRTFSDRQKLEVDAPLTAIVGPNEAGKTSLLDAMRRLNDTRPIRIADRTRRQAVSDDHPVVAGLYLVEEGDRREISHLHSASEPKRCRWLLLEKLAGGTLRASLLDPLVRDRRPRESARRHLSRLAKRPPWKHDPDATEARINEGELERALAVLASDEETLPQRSRKALQSIVRFLDELGDDRVKEASDALRDALAHESEQHPDKAALKIMRGRLPEFLLFDERQRELTSDYDLSEMASQPPPALRNLTNLAGLDLGRLLELIEQNESGEIIELFEEANRRLREAFSSWSQESISVYFDQGDGPVLRLHVSNPAGGYTKLEEHSDGLKIFVALLALTAHSDSDSPPIVLIDELERHLHYDAQADVVQVFARQEALPQIVYTTHSAGCLPEDLGTGVRLVGPVQETSHSRVQNRFWTQGEGFSPLLVGMGASTLAFVPVRNAVLSEGAAEVILLPTLMREGTGFKALGFQVAPASSEAPAAQIGGLDREAGRVAWLVDGDKAGKDLAIRLKAAGIPKDRIIPLGGERSAMVLEDLLRTEVYVAAYNEELRRSGSHKELPTSALRGMNRPKRAREWCRANKVGEPSKVNVANRVLDLRLNYEELLDARGKLAVRKLHSRLQKIFRELPVIPSILKSS